MTYLIYFTVALILYLTYDTYSIRMTCRKCGRKLNKRVIDRHNNVALTCKNRCNMVKQKE